MTTSHQGDIILLAIFLIVAILITLLGFLIKFKKQVSFVAGYDEKTCLDKDALANHVGGTLFKAGVLCAVAAITAFLIPAYIKYATAAYIIFMGVGTIIAAAGAGKYIKRS